MEIVYPRVAAIDVGKKIAAVAVRTPGERPGRRHQQLSRFPTADHLASWAGRCPGNNESAGKHHRGRTRKGNREVREALVEAASTLTGSAPAARRGV